MDQALPLISIITVVYNAKNALNDTLANIGRQVYKYKEVIVIDGGSNDGTVDVIHEYAPLITASVSEPDQGIYDAMNKGIDAAKGDWIIFMNAGDFFFNDEVLDDFFSRKNGYDGYDFIYGNHITKYPEYQFANTNPSPIKSLWKKLPFSHQSLFTRASLLKKRKFNTNLKIVADHDMIYECYVNGSKFLHVPRFVSISTLGGVSDLKRVESYLERKNFISRYPSSWQKVLYFRLKIITEKLKAHVRSLLGANAVNKFVKLRNYTFRDIIT